MIASLLSLQMCLSQKNDLTSLQSGIFCRLHNLMIYDVLVYRARRSEARIQQMLWKVNYSDIVFINTVCATTVTLLLSTYRDHYVPIPLSK